MSRLIVLLLTWIGFTAGARAFVTSYALNGQPARWNLVSPQLTHPNVVNRTTRAVRYYLGAETYAGSQPAAVHQAIRNSFLQWQTIPGTILKFEEAGILSGALDVNVEDNTNVVFWAKTTTLVNNQMDDIRFATGVTFFSIFSDNSFAEADIVFNDVDFDWFTDYNNPPAAGNPQFVESVAMHEIGHFIGLDHSPLGAATMYARGGSSSGGMFVQGELSQDEIAAVQSIYGTAQTLATRGRLTGSVTLQARPVFGAVITLEDASGNIAGATLTRTNGQYELPALLPGTYRARVAPLDPVTASAADRLTTGLDIDFRFQSAETGFLPSGNVPVTITANQSTTQNFPVVAGQAPFKITRLRPVTSNPLSLLLVNSGGIVTAGQSNLLLGVYSPSLPASDATLEITGDGLTMGPAIFNPQAFVGYNLISVEVSVAADATPGLRSFFIRQGNHTAYAEGLLKVRPPFPDINRDGFDDRFQREFFVTPFAANAAPGLDPDGDGFSNYDEYVAGSNPTDRNSVLRFESITWNAAGATLRWNSAAGRKYRLSTRDPRAAGANWVSLGQVTSSGPQTDYAHPGASSAAMLYRLEAVP